MIAQSRYWWMLIVRGVIALALGILLLIRPGPALGGIVFAFGLWALLDGLSAFGAAWSRRGGAELIFEGFAGVAIGILTFVLPGATALVLYLCATVWVLVTGVLKIVGAVRLRHVLHHELWLALSGIISVLFGVLLLATPGLGLLVMALWLGIFAIFYGILEIAFGLRVRSGGTIAA